MAISSSSSSASSRISGMERWFATFPRADSSTRIFRSMTSFQVASLSRIICRLRLTVHDSPRFLHRTQGGCPSRMLHFIFCFRQATHAVIFLVISGGFLSPNCSLRAMILWVAEAEGEPEPFMFVYSLGTRIGLSGFMSELTPDFPSTAGIRALSYRKFRVSHCSQNESQKLNELQTWRCASRLLLPSFRTSLSNGHTCRAQRLHFTTSPLSTNSRSLSLQRYEMSAMYLAFLVVWYAHRRKDPKLHAKNWYTPIRTTPQMLQSATGGVWKTLLAM